LKKVILFTLIITLLFTSFNISYATKDEEITLCINGMYVTFDQMPFNKDGRVLVPLRGIFEILGATVEYDGETRKITATKKSDKIELTIDDKNAYINGVKKELDVPPTIVGGRTFVPVRFVSEALGAVVNWNDETKTVDIKMMLSSSKMTFDDMETISSDKDYTVGGSYSPSDVSLSNEYDHTLGTGKSIKVDNLRETNSRLKLKNMFSKDDIGKTLTVTAWIYIPNQDANIRMGVFGEKGTTCAASPVKMKNFTIEKNKWTKLEYEYTHQKEEATQLGFDQVASQMEVATLIYVDDVSVSVVEDADFENVSAITGVYTSYESLKSRKRTPGFEMNFDDKEELVSGKDFITGGGLNTKYISLSDKDHTTGSGKSMRIEGIEKGSHRIKFMNTFSDVDLKKYYNVSFWVYLEGAETDEPSKVTFGVFGDQGLPNAAITKGFTSKTVEHNKWVHIEGKVVHENPLSTQLGIYQGGNISPIMYIDDIKLEEYTILDNGRRKVPVSTLTSTSDLSDLYHYEDSMAKRYKFEDLPEGKVIYTTERFLKSGWQGEKYGKIETIDVEGMPFDKAIRVTVENDPPLEYSCQLELGNLSKDDYEEGDILLVKVSMRTIFAENEDASGALQLICEKEGPPNTKCLKADMTCRDTGEWMTGYYAFKVLFPRLTIRVGFDNQIIDIADYQIINYGKDIDINLMPAPDTIRTLYAAYNDPDAQWRKDAIERIEKIRKGDINVIVKDANGNPISTASVDVSMFEHEFSFGSAFNANASRESATDAMLYREYFSQMFNAAVSESDHKPAQYYLNPETQKSAKELVRIAKEELGTKNYRGHVLITDRVNPALDEFEMPDFSTMTQEEKQTFREQINAARERYISKGMTDFAGQLCEWDVLNETTGVHFLRDHYGVDIYKDWYAIARKYADEGMNLFYNEARVLDPVFWQLMRDMIEADVDFQGIGLECHMRVTEPSEIINMFDNLCSLGKRIAITEFDNNESDPFLQAAFLRDFMIIMFSYEEVDRFLMWGFNDKAHWLKNAPIFYPDWSLKPSGEQYVDLVYNKWWTQEKGVTNESGTYSTRGYYGDYDITVTLSDGRQKTVTAQCYKNNNNTIEVVFE